MSIRARPGIALILAIVLLVVLECIVLGVLETARMQRRIAWNRARSLDVRHQAEGAARRALVEWPPEPALSAGLATARRIDGATVRLTFTRLADDLVMIEAEALATRPAGVRHAAALLARAPVLDTGDDPAAAALTAASAVLTPTSSISDGPAYDCQSASAPALRTAGAAIILPGAAVSGGIREYDADVRDPAHALARAAADPRLHVAHADTTLDSDASGLLLVRGATSLKPGTRFHGLIIGGADLDIAEGAGVVGAVWIGGAATIRGSVTHDACAVRDAVHESRLRSARPLAGRPWVPAF